MIEKTMLEMLEPLVYDDEKLCSIMGGRNSAVAQAKLHEAREWLQNHWKDDENIKTKNVGKYSAWFIMMNRKIIYYYALKGFEFFANTQKKAPDRLMKMAVKAHAIELGGDYAKPKVILIDPLRIDVLTLSAFQRADDLFSNTKKYLVRDKQNHVIIEKSGWLPSKEENMGPIFMWMVKSAYETNLFGFEYFIKAQKLAEKVKKEDDRVPLPDSTDREKNNV